MEKICGVSWRDFEKYGLHVVEGQSIQGALTYERPLFLWGPRRVKNSSIGAFTMLNGHQSSSIYSTKIGRYCSLGEDSVIGPPEHPTNWFSTSVVAFTRPEYTPKFYRSPEFVKLAPDSSMPDAFTVPGRTVIGHDAYVGAGAFVKRNVSIGHGAVIGASAVVVKDVPPYAIYAGVPAKFVRMRFAEKLVERMLKLEWWLYDLAPYKRSVDFSRVEATLDYLEEQKAGGHLNLLQPETWRVSQPVSLHATGADNPFDVERLSTSLY